MIMFTRDVRPSPERVDRVRKLTPDAKAYTILGQLSPRRFVAADRTARVPSSSIRGTGIHSKTLNPDHLQAEPKQRDEKPAPGEKGRAYRFRQCGGFSAPYTMERLHNN